MKNIMIISTSLSLLIATAAHAAVGSRPAVACRLNADLHEGNWGFASNDCKKVELTVRIGEELQLENTDSECLRFQQLPSKQGSNKIRYELSINPNLDDQIGGCKIKRINGDKSNIITIVADEEND